MQKIKTLKFGLVVLLFIYFNSNAQLTITTDTVMQISPCAGSNILIPFTVSGGSFNFGNVFTAELSDNLGNFTNPVAIGTLTYWSSGLIIGTIPITTTISIFYKVRVVASNPSTIGSESPNNVIVSNIAQLSSILALPNDTICQGDSTTLTVGPNDAYNWSTGDTTQSITVVQTGSYNVTVVDFAGCETVADSISVYNFPITPAPTITLVNDTLISSIAVSYQWLFNDSVITGATNQSYYPNNVPGTYNVLITDTNGCEAISDNFIFTSKLILENSKNITIYPNPSNGVFEIISTNQSISEIKITNMLGKTLANTNYDIKSNKHYSLDMQQFNSGIYLIHIYTGKNRIIKKIIIE